MLVGLQASCMCGNANCPWLVIRVGDPAHVLLSTIAVGIEVERGAETLPRLRATIHNNAFFSDETLDVYRGGRYVAGPVYHVRGDTRERKPVVVPVHFTSGASSARVHGRLWPGWGDVYKFAAQSGQRLTVGDVDRPGLDIYLTDQSKSTTVLQPGLAVTLAGSGNFTLVVDGHFDREVPYAFTLSIR